MSEESAPNYGRCIRAALAGLVVLALAMILMGILGRTRPVTFRLAATCRDIHIPSPAFIRINHVSRVAMRGYEAAIDRIQTISSKHRVNSVFKDMRSIQFKADQTNPSGPLPYISVTTGARTTPITVFFSEEITLSQFDAGASEHYMEIPNPNKGAAVIALDTEEITIDQALRLSPQPPSIGVFTPEGALHFGNRTTMIHAEFRSLDRPTAGVGYARMRPDSWEDPEFLTYKQKGIVVAENAGEVKLGDCDRELLHLGRVVVVDENGKNGNEITITPNVVDVNSLTMQPGRFGVILSGSAVSIYDYSGERVPTTLAEILSRPWYQLGLLGAALVLLVSAGAVALSRVAKVLSEELIK